MYCPHNQFIPNWKSLLKTVAFKEVKFKSINNENVELHGLFIKGNNPKFCKYPLLFLHGNAGNVSHRIDNLLLLHNEIGCDIFIFDYRGYGKSIASNIKYKYLYKPTQNGLIDDAISAINQLYILCNDNNIKPIIFGRSLGGAVAIHIIDKIDNKKIGGVIIENSFISIWHCVNKNKLLYPFIIDKWDNIKCIDKLSKNGIINIPFLFISAVNDTLLDSSMMKYLINYCVNKCKFSKVTSVEFEDGDHNDTYLCKGYSQCIAQFIHQQQL